MDFLRPKPRPTRVVNRKKSAFDVYVGRPSQWGNPFSHLSDSLAEFKTATHAEAVAAYWPWLLKQRHLLMQVHELKGMVLGCWCRPKDCHADFLAKLADAGPFTLTGLDQVACLGSFPTFKEAIGYAESIQEFGLCLEFSIGTYLDGQFTELWRESLADRLIDGSES